MNTQPTHKLTDEEQQLVIEAMDNLLKSRPSAIGNLRKIAKRILERLGMR